MHPPMIMQYQRWDCARVSPNTKSNFEVLELSIKWTVLYMSALSLIMKYM